jgi:hypothetical protein
MHSPDTPPADESQDLTVLSGSVRTGQHVTIYAFPAGRFGDFEPSMSGPPQPLGANRTGSVERVEHIECPVGDGEQEWTVPGVRVTFTDGTQWDSVDHAVAHWHGGPRPTLADLKAAEALVDDMREQQDAAEAAYTAEGVLADFNIHAALAEDGEHVVVVHTPFDEPDDDPIAVTPEQAEQFALRLMQAAALARVGRQTMGHQH